MTANRRRFLSGILASLGGLAFRARPSCAAHAAGDEPADRPGSLHCLDYGLSFVCNPSPANAVRFWVESRTTLFDDEAGTAVEFYQCGSCKSENTFAEKDLFSQDNYDFMPIFGGEDLLIFRRPVGLSERYRQVTLAEAVWGQPEFKLREAPEVRALDTWEQVWETTAAGVPIVARTEIGNSETGLRAVIEYPVKTMNISLEHRMYQVDTGPVALPDLSKRFERPIASLSLAFVAFNAPHFADFVVEQPTPVREDGREVCRVYHYSDPFSLSAKNVLLAAGTVR